MILVRCNETGDAAEALDPESAVFAALTLVDDDLRGYCSAGPRVRTQGRRFTFRFEVDGDVVGGAYAVPESTLWAAKV